MLIHKLTFRDLRLTSRELQIRRAFKPEERTNFLNVLYVGEGYLLHGDRPFMAHISIRVAERRECNNNQTGWFIARYGSFLAKGVIMMPISNFNYLKYYIYIFLP